MMIGTRRLGNTIGRLAGPLVLALALPVSTTANATVYSYSALSLSNLAFSEAVVPVNFTQDASASVAGVSPAPAHSSCSTAGCAPDVPQVFASVGAGAGANPGSNQFGLVGKVNSYARADGTVPGTAVTGGSNASLIQVAETAVGPNGTSAASAKTTLHWSYHNAGVDGALTARFHAVLVLAFDLSDPGANSATADLDFLTSLAGPTFTNNPLQSFRFSAGPTALTRTVGGLVADVNPLTDFQVFEGDYSVTFNVLSGQDYQFELAATNSVAASSGNVNRVPEPMTGSLAALGIFGVGFFSRRRKTV